MPFITQGKTDWKFLLIVVILAAIIGGGILGYLLLFNQEIVSLSQFIEIKKPEKIIIHSPSKGDEWVVSRTYQIRWTPSDPARTVGIILRDMRIPSASLSKIWQKEQIPNTGSYDFTVPDVSSGDEYQIYISTKDIYGYSSVFSIIGAREVVDWTEITSNLEFREYFEEIMKANSGLEGIKKFTKETIKPIKSSEVQYPSPPKSKDEPEWVFSPNGTKALSIFAYFGEPDSSLDIYNRRNDGKVERLKDCGTPCSYWIVFWLNDEQFIFVQRIIYNRDYPLTLEHGPYVLIVSLYDLAEDEKISYTSQEVEEYPNRPSWPKWDEKYFKKVCAKLFGEEYCQTTPK